MQVNLKILFIQPFPGYTTKPKKSIAVTKKKRTHSHAFRIKAPLLARNQVICVLGNSNSMGEWSTKDPILFKKEGNWWTGQADLSEESFPIAYKYGVYDTEVKKFIQFEAGDNRLLFGDAGKRN